LALDGILIPVTPSSRFGRQVDRPVDQREKGGFKMKPDDIYLLIVDDEEAFLASIACSLELRGFKVFTANSGENALAVARNHPIDIALVDLKMPGIDGHKTLQELKKEHDEMEIVILTGHGTIDSAAACSRDGAYAYLQKPCELDQLLETLMLAYKKHVMTKKDIEEKKLDAILNIAMGNSPREIIRKLRDFDKRRI
jgi:DNA-binding NtrC family response regulator